MVLRPDAVCFSASDPGALELFWSRLLGPAFSGDLGLQLRFVGTDEPKVGQNQLHFDLTSASLEEQQRTVQRALALGARHLDLGQRPEEGHVVLADPEGNELCVIGPGNNFLAGCPFLGCLTCDGSQAVGYFWSAALGWPLVWDQDEETAIQAPQGGSKISWGGTTPIATTMARRLHLDLVSADGVSRLDEVDRLVSLGATRLDTPSHIPGAVHLADPDGNEFCVSAS